MSDGIIYIARNEEHPENRYKVGKSDRADPSHRMSELTRETTNIGEFKHQGYVLVNEVDECERLIHEELDQYRVRSNREYFECSIDIITSKIKETLSNFIINDHLNNANNVTIQKKGRKIENLTSYGVHDNNHPLNFITNIENLNFFEVCKVAYFQKWNISTCTCTACNLELRQIYFLLVYKKVISLKIKKDSNFVPIGKGLQIEGHTNEQISKKEALILQDEIIKTDIKELITEIPLEKFLIYFIEALALINVTKIKENNQKLADFFYKSLKKIYPKARQNLRKLDSMRYVGGEAFDPNIAREIYHEHIDNQRR